MASKKTSKGKASKTRKASKVKARKGKETEQAASIARLETAKGIYSLPQFGKIFGGEIAADFNTVNAINVNPDLGMAIGSNERQTPLRIKKSALLAFCKVATYASPEFKVNLDKACNGKPLSAMGKHALQVALFSLMTATEFSATYKAYRDTLET